MPLSLLSSRCIASLPAGSHLKSWASTPFSDPRARRVHKVLGSLHRRIRMIRHLRSRIHTQVLLRHPRIHMPQLPLLQHKRTLMPRHHRHHSPIPTLHHRHHRNRTRMLPPLLLRNRIHTEHRVQIRMPPRLNMTPMLPMLAHPHS